MTEPYRVMVVEDDLDVAEYTRTILENKLGCTVLTFTDPTEVLASVGDFRPEVVITDIEMPGMSGLDLIVQLREAQPGIPVIVMTAHASIDYAVTALRNQANEFLTKPISSSELVSHVRRLAEDSRVRANAAGKSVVLAIGAHPDDVEIGVGGTLAAHRAAGDPVAILTLSSGSRDGGIRAAWEEGSASARLIGARLLMEELPAREFRQEQAVDVIAKAVAELLPTIIYVHTEHDRDQDHRTAFGATMIAASDVSSLVCFQGSTATVDYRPNRFVTIDGFTDAKLAMLDCFARGGSRPGILDPDLALATARYWARFGQGTYCEPLEIIRESGQVG